MTYWRDTAAIKFKDADVLWYPHYVAVVIVSPFCKLLKDATEDAFNALSSPELDEILKDATDVVFKELT